MNKVSISENFVMPSFQTVNKNQQSTQLILMDPENGNLYLLHQYFCNDADDYGQLIALLETQANEGVQSPYVLNPIVYLPIKYTNQQFQTSHFVQVLYEYGSHTLEQQLFLRIQQKNYFQQHQIWSILGSCVLGLKNLKDKQFNHRSVCMTDIFVTKQGQIKICHPMFRTYDHAYSQQIQQNYFERAINENYFFAPQQLPQDKNLIKFKSSKKQITHEDSFKSDIFSLAMSMISLCILHPIKDCYVKKGFKNYSKITIQSGKLGQYFNALQQIYSHDLVSLLFNMVSYHAEDRITLDQLATHIQQMIQAKTEEQQKQIINQDNYQDEGKQQMMRKNDENNQFKYSSDEKFGKFSRVSQASPLSGRKTNRSHYNGPGSKLQGCDPDLQDKPSILAIQCDNDYENQDKSQNQQQSQLNESKSQISKELIEQLQQKNRKQKTQNKIIQSQTTNENKQQKRQEVIQQKDQSQSQSIDQTLKQYINNGTSSNVTQVNQTKLYEQYEKQKLRNKNNFSPQQVVSIVMTSKQLSSLPDQTSFVVQKHVINNQNLVYQTNILKKQLSINKQNKMNYSNGFNNPKTNEAQKYKQQYNSINKRQSIQNKSKGNSNIKNFLNVIKQRNNQFNQLPKSNDQNNPYLVNQIYSARTYQQNRNYHHNHYYQTQYVKIPSQATQQYKQTQYRYNHKDQNNKMFFNPNFTNLNSYKNTINQTNNNKSPHYQQIVNKKQNNNLSNSNHTSMSVSLNKQYDKIIQIQKNNPNHLYTDPKFLSLIRQDVNKILKKRKLKLTSLQNPQSNPTLKPSPILSNHTFINNQPINNLYKNTHSSININITSQSHYQNNNKIKPINYFNNHTTYPLQNIHPYKNKIPNLSQIR